MDLQDAGVLFIPAPGTFRPPVFYRLAPVDFTPAVPIVTIFTFTPSYLIDAFFAKPPTDDAFGYLNRFGYFVCGVSFVPCSKDFSGEAGIMVEDREPFGVTELRAVLQDSIRSPLRTKCFSAFQALDIHRREFFPKRRHVLRSMRRRPPSHRGFAKTLKILNLHGPRLLQTARSAPFKAKLETC
jgi:hypothetical protein